MPIEDAVEHQVRAPRFGKRGGAVGGLDLSVGGSSGDQGRIAHAGEGTA